MATQRDSTLWMATVLFEADADKRQARYEKLQAAPAGHRKYLRNLTRAVMYHWDLQTADDFADRVDAVHAAVAAMKNEKSGEVCFPDLTRECLWSCCWNLHKYTGDRVGTAQGRFYDHRSYLFSDKPVSWFLSHITYFCTSEESRQAPRFSVSRPGNDNGSFLIPATVSDEVLESERIPVKDGIEKLPLKRARDIVRRLYDVHGKEAFEGTRRTEPTVSWFEIVDRKAGTTNHYFLAANPGQSFGPASLVYTRLDFGTYGSEVIDLSPY